MVILLYNLIMKLTKTQVKYVAKLANIPLTEAQEQEYSGQLSKILDYIDQLNKVFTKGVEPTFNVLKLNTIERPDETAPDLTQEEALFNVEKKENGFFVTKGVFDEK